MKRTCQYQEGYGAENFNNSTKVYFRKKGGGMPSVLSKDDREHINALVKKLKPTERQVFQFTFVDERRLMPSQIALELNIKSRGSVYNIQQRLNRKLAQLRPLLESTHPQNDTNSDDKSQEWEPVIPECNTEKAREAAKGLSVHDHPW